MNRAERRRKERETNKNTKLLKWLAGLNYDQRMLLTEYCNEVSKEDLYILFNAFETVLRPWLYEEYGIVQGENMLKTIINEVTEEGKCIREYKSGSEYFMKISNDVKNIVNYYEKLKSDGYVEKDILKQLYIKFHYSKNALKNVIAEHNRNERENNAKQCDSKTCPFVKDGKCDNDIVILGKAPCNSYDTSVKTYKIEPKEEKKEIPKEEHKTRKELIFEFIEANIEGMSKEELYAALRKEFNMTKANVYDYFYRYKKENENKEEKIKNEIIPKEKIEMDKFELKEISKVLIADVEGSYDSYHIENKEVITSTGLKFNGLESLNSTIAFIKNDLESQLALLDKREKEYLEVVKRYL